MASLMASENVFRLNPERELGWILDSFESYDQFLGLRKFIRRHGV